MVSGIIDASGQPSSVLPRSGRINYGILDDRRPTEDLFGKITYDSEETGSRTVQANEIFQFLSDDQIKRISSVKNVWWSQKQDSSVTCAIVSRGAVRVLGRW